MKESFLLPNCTLRSSSQLYPCCKRIDKLVSANVALRATTTNIFLTLWLALAPVVLLAPYGDRQEDHEFLPFL